MQKAVPRGREPQRDTDEFAAAVTDQIAPVGRARVPPAEEVQILPGPLLQITGQGDPLGLALEQLTNEPRMSCSVSGRMVVPPVK